MDPLEVNTKTGELYLRLPAPFSNIILTPPRLSDAAPSIAILHDPKISTFLGPSLPTPYEIADAEKWLAKLKAETDTIIQELASGESAVRGCPVRHLRELRADGTDVFIGDVGVARSTWPEVLDVEEKRRRVEENSARAPGDPEISWNISYYIAPSHQGRGLATAAVNAILTQWCVPRMNTRHIRTSVFAGNPASVKVLEKNGFVMVDTLVEHYKYGDTKMSVHLLEWKQ
ncbi:acyl-CoA N-acyltransferase [Mycena rebaudengoi]|nr:acyl-CoA N-acyltransferase [Mycena rebaudengoi]